MADETTATATPSPTDATAQAAAQTQSVDPARAAYEKAGFSDEAAPKAPAPTDTAASAANDERPKPADDSQSDSPNTDAQTQDDAGSGDDDQDSAQTNQTDTEAYRERVVKMREAMRRDGWSKERIAAADPKDWLEWAEAKAAKRQRDADQAYNDLRALKNKDFPAGQAKTGQPADDSAFGRSDGADLGGPASIDNAAKAALDQFVAENALDASQATRLGKIIAEMARRDPELLQQRQAITEQTRTLTEGLQRVAHDRLSSVRRELAEEFPGINDQSKWERVVRKMAAADPDQTRILGDREAFAEFAREYAWTVFGPETRKQVTTALLAKNAKAARGQPDPVKSSAAASPGALTPKEYDEAVFNLTFGKKLSGARLDQELAKLPRQMASA